MAQHGAWTRDVEIKSGVLYWLSQLGASWWAILSGRSGGLCTEVWLDVVQKNPDPSGGFYDLLKVLLESPVGQACWKTLTDMGSGDGIKIRSQNSMCGIISFW